MTKKPLERDVNGSAADHLEKILKQMPLNAEQFHQTVVFLRREDSVRIYCTVSRSY